MCCLEGMRLDPMASGYYFRLRCTQNPAKTMQTESICKSTIISHILSLCPPTPFPLQTRPNNHLHITELQYNNNMYRQCLFYMGSVHVKGKNIFLGGWLFRLACAMFPVLFNAARPVLEVVCCCRLGCCVCSICIGVFCTSPHRAGRRNSFFAATAPNEHIYYCVLA